jgi:hypothetical protein
MSKVGGEVEIAQLANLLLGDPENNLDRFSEFFAFGMDRDRLVDSRVRSLALLSATAVLIDILPSLVIPEGQAELTDDKSDRVSRDQRSKVKRGNQILTLFDTLLTKLSKSKLVRGACALLNSSVCSRACLDQRRMTQLVSVVVSLASQSTGKEAVAALKTRVKKDLSDNIENLDIVKLIVQAIVKEKQPERLNLLLPIIGGMRFHIPNDSTPTTNVHDKRLARDLALGQTSGVDRKKWAHNQASILSDSMALFIQVLRTVASTHGIYTFDALRTCIEGVGGQTGQVNADLAIELETELLELAKYYLVTKRMSDSSDDGLLGATALNALLNISKGSKERQSMLSSAVISAVETLVPAALNRLITSATTTSSSASSLVVDLCKGALGVASQWGSDRCLLSIANALLNSLCLRVDDQAGLIVELLIHIAGRSALTRAAVDPDGVLVDGTEDGNRLERTEIHFYPQLKNLLSHCVGGRKHVNVLLAQFSQYAPSLARKETRETLSAVKQQKEAAIVSKKRNKMDKKAALGPNKKRK